MREAVQCHRGARVDQATQPANGVAVAIQTRAAFVKRNHQEREIAWREARRLIQQALRFLAGVERQRRYVVDRGQQRGVGLRRRRHARSPALRIYTAYRAPCVAHHDGRVKDSQIRING